MKRFFAAIIVVLVVATAMPALTFAHGDAPLAEEVWGVGDHGWVLRTNFGVMTSDDPHSFVCEEAFTGGGRFQVAALDTRRWLVFTRDAVLHTDDGCDFEVVRELPRNPAGVAVSPGRTGVVYLMNGDDAEHRGLWHIDGDQTVKRPPLQLDGLHLTRARFIEEDRLVVSAYATDEAASGQAHLLLVDLADDTATEMGDLSDYERPYMLDAAGDSLVWLARHDGNYMVFWGTHAEPTLRSTVVERWPDGANLSDDGQTVWIAGTREDGRGVLVGRAGDEPVFSEHLTEHSALCIGRVGSDYHLCARRDREGHDLSRIGSDDEVVAVVDFTDLEGPRDSCPAGSDVATACPPVWPELAPALGIEVEPGEDAGGDADVGADAGEARESGAAEGCGGCASAHGGGGGAWLLVLIVGGFAVREVRGG